MLYIAGDGRSGSTVLSRILGQVHGWVAPGELRYVWERGVAQDRLCECNQPFNSCPMWRKVLDVAFEDSDSAPQPERVTMEDRAALRLRQRARLLVADHAPHQVPTLPVFADHVRRLYPALQEVTGARVIVDSSKLPSYGQLLDALPEIDVLIVHLVRDARASCYSWLRRKPLTDTARQAVMSGQTPAQSATAWTFWNAVARHLWRDQPERYLQVRYEDFVREPAATVRRIVTFADPGAAPPPITDGRVCIARGHSVAGNPNRFEAGEIRLRPDDEWREAMKRRDVAVVTALTWPLLRAFGYPLRRRGRGKETNP